MVFLFTPSHGQRYVKCLQINSDKSKLMGINSSQKHNAIGNSAHLSCARKHCTRRPSFLVPFVGSVHNLVKYFHPPSIQLVELNTMTETIKSPAREPRHKPYMCQCNFNCHYNVAVAEVNETTVDPPSTPVRNGNDGSAHLTPCQSDGSRSHDGSASSKRCHLISFDSGDELDGSGSARKLNYKSSLPSHTSEGSVDELDDYKYEVARRMTVKKLWQVNYGNEDDYHIQTSEKCKLYEFVTWKDVVTGKELVGHLGVCLMKRRQKLKANGTHPCDRIRFVDD